MKEKVVEKMRGVVRDCVSKHLYSSAIFFADKVAAMTSDPADIYMQAQALFLGGHYRRALHLLTASQIVLRDLRFRYLAAKCLEELKEWHQCLEMLGDAKVDEYGNVSDANENNAIYLDKDGEDCEINIISAICFLRGKAHEALENRTQARQWYQAAFREDPLCYEALECLIDNYMLTYEEESKLLLSVKFSSEDGWLSTFYSCLLKKYDKEDAVEAKFKELEKENWEFRLADSLFNVSFKNNTDLLVCKADYYHQCGEYQKCFALTSVLLERDPFHLKCTLIHLIASMELGHSNDLYIMASDLVKEYPQNALSWFAVGCYYYCIKNYDQARRYFSKSTSLNGAFAPAWFGSGNAYAAQEESDQAMRPYRTAARLFPGFMRRESDKSINFRPFSRHASNSMNHWIARIPTDDEIKETLMSLPNNKEAPGHDGFSGKFSKQIGRSLGPRGVGLTEIFFLFFLLCHLPTLYIGMEYMRTHNFKLAEQFFMQAKTICPFDPLVYNELGVVAYQTKEYQKAVRWFEMTLSHIPSSLGEMWEPTLVNHAHSLRKLKRYKEAINYYEKALTLSTRSFSTYAGLAYSYHLQDNFDSAITYYHKALWLKPDDRFCTEMLTLALTDETHRGNDIIDMNIPSF